MKSILKKAGTMLLFVPMLALSAGLFMSGPNVSAADCDPKTGLGGALGEGGCAAEAAETSGMQTGNLFGNGSIINTVINVMLFLIGILSVIMIIFGGIRYVISRGKSEEVTNAKNTIMYAIIGLIVAIIAYALVNFVFTSIGQG